MDERYLQYNLISRSIYLTRNFMSIDWTHIHKKYAGQWVAFKADEETVVASGRTLKVAHRRAVEKGLAKPIMSFVPKDGVTFVG